MRRTAPKKRIKTKQNKSLMSKMLEKKDMSETIVAVSDRSVTLNITPLVESKLVKRS